MRLATFAGMDTPGIALALDLTPPVAAESPAPAAGAWAAWLASGAAPPGFPAADRAAAGGKDSPPDGNVVPLPFAVLPLAALSAGAPPGTAVDATQSRQGRPALPAAARDPGPALPTPGAASGPAAEAAPAVVVRSPGERPGLLPSVPVQPPLAAAANAAATGSPAGPLPAPPVVAPPEPAAALRTPSRLPASDLGPPPALARALQQAQRIPPPAPAGAATAPPAPPVAATGPVPPASPPFAPELVVAAGDAAAETPVPAGAPQAAALGAPPREPAVVPTLQLAERPGSEAFSRALGERVIVMADRDLSQARIALNPPQLGPIEVRVQVNGEQASVSFSAHSHVAREALEQAMPRLREMLGSQGFTQVDVNVSQQSYGERPPPPDRWLAAAPAGDAAPGPGDAPLAPSARGSSSRLDLYA